MKSLSVITAITATHQRFPMVLFSIVKERTPWLRSYVVTSEFFTMYIQLSTQTSLVLRRHAIHKGRVRDEPKECRLSS